MNFLLLLFLLAIIFVAPLEAAEPDLSGVFNGITGWLGSIGGLAGGKKKSALHYQRNLLSMPAGLVVIFSGEWRVFTGNEMGAIITWWIWTNWRNANPTVDASKVYILNSAVSSQIVKTIADAEGFKNETTLTGFKWMGKRAEELRAEGNHVIIAWEESIGYMLGHTLDKDGVSAAAVFAEIAAFLQTEGKTLHYQLYALYNRYGFHVVRSTYWFVLAPQVTKELFATLRADLKFPNKIGDADVAIVRDLTNGYDNSKPDNKPVLPLSTSSEMVTFFLKNGSITTLRASGTEPKIKYYIELITAPGKNPE